MRIDGQGRRAPRRPADGDRDADGLQHRRLWQSRPPAFCSMARASRSTLYRCPNKKVDGYAVYTNTMPSGAFRGYGLSQTNFAIESAMDELARKLGIDPFAFRRRNVVRPGDPLVSDDDGPHDVEFGSYGLDQCLDLVEARLTTMPTADLGDDWLVGRGVAAGMIDTIPPRGHHADCRIRLAEDGATSFPSAPPSSATARPRCMGRSPRACWRRRSIGCASASPTPTLSRMTPAPSAAPGTVVAGRGDARGGGGARRSDPRFRRRSFRRRSDGLPAGRRSCRRPARASSPSPRSAKAAVGRGAPLERARPFSAGTPRSVAFNVQGFEVAVHRRYGEIRILRSIHAADAGAVVNPMQCRGQVEGGVAQAIGAALYEKLIDRRRGQRRQSDLPRLSHSHLRRRARDRSAFRRRPSTRSGRSAPSR